MAKKYPIGFGGYSPLNYSQISNIEGRINPSMVKYCDSATFAYWQRSLFQRAISTIDFKGLPETWEGSVKDFFYWCIFAYGHVGVFNSRNFGLSFQPGNPYGFDFYYQPTDYIVANPKLNKTFKIHKDIEVIKLTPDWRGIFDIITYYSMMLSMLDAGISSSIINSKFAYLLGAKNKAAAETLNKIFDQINAGEPFVAFDENLLKNDPNDKEEPYNFLERSNLKNSYLTTDQLMDRQTILSAFDAEIGIKSIYNNNKKERMVTAEAEGREQDSTARLEVWKASLESSLKLVNNMFGTDISVEMRYEKIEKEDLINGNDFISDNTGRN